MASVVRRGHRHGDDDVAHGRREQARIAILPESARIALLVGAFALYYVAPGLPLSLLLLAVCAVLCYVQLPLAVSLVPLAMPFFMLPKHLGHPNPEFSLGETALVLCAAAYVLRRALEPPPREQRDANLLRRFIPASPLERAVALFFVAATLATLAAHFRHEALRQYRWTVLEPIAYYVLVVALLRDMRAMARALWAVVARRRAGRRARPGPVRLPSRDADRLLLGRARDVSAAPRHLGLRQPQQPRPAARPRHPGRRRARRARCWSLARRGEPRGHAACRAISPWPPSSRWRVLC